MQFKHDAAQYKTHLVAVTTLLLAAVDSPGVQACVASADKWKNRDELTGHSTTVTGTGN
jgi:hypothetical protein